MLVSEVVKLTCSYLQLNDLLNKLELGSPLDAGSQKEKDLLVKCCNLTANLIVSDYLPQLKTIRRSSTNGMISYIDITPNVIFDILSVTNVLGDKVVFKCFDTYLKTVMGSVDITYSSAPADASYSENIFAGQLKLNARIVAYGVAAEYCFIKGMFEEASAWDARFKNAMLTAARKKVEVKIKPRVWE